MPRVQAHGLWGDVPDGRVTARPSSELWLKFSVKCLAPRLRASPRRASVGRTNAATSRSSRSSRSSSRSAEGAQISGRKNERSDSLLCVAPRPSALPSAIAPAVAALIGVSPCRAATPATSEENEAKRGFPAETFPIYWAEGEPRSFIAARGIAGLGYGRAAVDVGYGMPYWKWIGLDAAGILTLDSLSGQAGLRGSWMIAEGFLTVRRTASLTHRAVGAAREVSSETLERNGASGAAYTVIDADLWGCIPFGRFLATWELAWVRPLSLSPGQLVLEEIQRVVVGPEGVVTPKVGINFALTERKKAYLGGMAEYLRLSGRAAGNVYRLGPAFWWGLTDHLELGGYLTWPVHSPDSLGFMTGMYGSLGLQYQFASGEPRPQFP